MLRRTLLSILAAASLAAFVLVLFPAESAAQSGGIKGRVRTASGKAIPNATVTARLDGKDVRSATTDSRGSFEVRGLGPGIYNVVVEATGFSSGIRYGVEVKNSVRNIGDRLILNVDQGTLVIIRGSVFFKEGNSMQGAKVELFEVDGNGSLKRLGQAFTSFQGEFTFRRPEGPAKLRVTASFKGVSASKDIEVETAAIYRTAITLDLPRNDR